MMKVKIGNGTKICIFVMCWLILILKKIVGHRSGCPNVNIGNNVKVQNNVSIYDGITIEDDVFYILLVSLQM